MINLKRLNMIDDSEVIDWLQHPVTKGLMISLKRLKAQHGRSILELNALDKNARVHLALSRGVIEGINYTLNFNKEATKVVNDE